MPESGMLCGTGSSSRTQLERTMILTQVQADMMVLLEECLASDDGELHYWALGLVHEYSSKCPSSALESFPHFVSMP